MADSKINCPNAEAFKKRFIEKYGQQRWDDTEKELEARIPGITEGWEIPTKH